MHLSKKQRTALRRLIGHGATMNSLVRRKLVTYHQKIEMGLYDGKLVTYWYTRTPQGEELLRKIEAEDEND